MLTVSLILLLLAIKEFFFPFLSLPAPPHQSFDFSPSHFSLVTGYFYEYLTHTSNTECSKLNSTPFHPPPKVSWSIFIFLSILLNSFKVGEKYSPTFILEHVVIKHILSSFSFNSLCHPFLKLLLGSYYRIYG